MADPATMTAVAKIGSMAIGAIGMGLGAQGAHEEAAASREDAVRMGEAMRQQNSRLLAGPGAPPAYSQNVQGYGFADPATGQYATTNEMPVFTDGSAGVADPVMLDSQPVNVINTPAQGTMQPVGTPDLRAAYQQYLQQFQ